MRRKCFFLFSPLKERERKRGALPLVSPAQKDDEGFLFNLLAYCFWWGVIMVRELAAGQGRAPPQKINPRIERKGMMMVQVWVRLFCL